jgi:tetratricopeptide (TPR) repeat protein
MSAPRTYLLALAAVCLAVVSLCAAGADETPSGTDAPHQIAKAPTQELAAPPTDKPAAMVPSTTAAASHDAKPKGEAPGAPAPALLEVALLGKPAPTDATALVELAHEYGFAWDHTAKRVCLEEAAARSAGTLDAGRALVILARTYYEAGEEAQGDVLSAQVLAEYSDPEIRAFADAGREYALALHAGDLDAAESVLREAAKTWRGTQLGGWAALQLGGLYRDYIADFGAAIPLYAAAAAAYPNSLVAEEAEVSIGECLAWSMVQHPEAAAHFAQILERLQSDRLAERARLGLGSAQMWGGEFTDAYAVLSRVIEDRPGSPGVALARAYRSYAASRLGFWEVAVADAAAFVASPAGRSGHPWAHHTHTVLGQDAFRTDAFELAAAHFSSAFAAAPDSEAKASAVAGVAHCRMEQGDLLGAAELFLQAADESRSSRERSIHLHQAASAARGAGDTALENQILGRMVEECPGSALTTRLLGYEVLPPTPDI